MSLCGETHPEEPSRTCNRPDGENHRLHQAGFGKSLVKWENDEYVDKRSATEQGRKNAKTMLDIVRRVEPERRSVGVQSNDPAARHAGSERAFGAAEPEFVEGTLDACRYLADRGQRFTVDEIWNRLEECGVSTEHPKAMTGIVRRACSMEIIRPVDKTSDPEGAFRTSERSNESRRIRVYEPIRSSVPLRNFD